ncbi:hypothetical protein [Aestuariivivens sp. NBU2969]|uniref:hypothetical protein n=1 Tax=Aestuariivivens sp. NBU2969 TaxID=2873267 RepID=UPI001CC03304|nr:hypothetical protein [Aestuariivivens sp. NBU2969]
MAQDIRELFKNEKFSSEKMPVNHQERFLKKLDEALPQAKRQSFRWYNIAASVVVLLGLSYGAFNYININDLNINDESNGTETVVAKTKTLGDVSPGLKKVEDYYLASINLELSKIKYTPETKEVFDGYITQLDELNKEYERLSLELTKAGPTELTINALIDNLKLRLNLLYRLKEQLKELTQAELQSQTA